MKKKNLWQKPDLPLHALEDFCEDYKQFLSACKTERECAAFMEKGLKASGCIPLKEIIEKGITPRPGDLICADMMKKALLIFRIGTRPVLDGMRILGAHIDSPRLDLKQNPLYEDSDLALLDTHYYGGIKKYQWVALPLALHGVIAKKTVPSFLFPSVKNRRILSWASLICCLTWPENRWIKRPVKRLKAKA